MSHGRSGLGMGSTKLTWQPSTKDTGSLFAPFFAFLCGFASMLAGRLLHIWAWYLHSRNEGDTGAKGQGDCEDLHVATQLIPHWPDFCHVHTSGFQDSERRSIRSAYYCHRYSLGSVTKRKGRLLGRTLAILSPNCQATMSRPKVDVSTSLALEIRWVHNELEMKYYV